MDWNAEFFGNPMLAWGAAAGMATAIWMLAFVVKWVVVHRLGKLAARSRTKLDDIVVEIARGTRMWLFIFIALAAGAQSLEFPARIIGLVRAAAVVALVLQLGIWASRALSAWIEQSRLARAENASATTSLAALSFLGRLLIWSVLLLVALDNLGVDVTALVAGLGIGGVAVALAVQNVLGDLFASLSIIIDKPFVNGDFVVVDDYSGTVEHVGLKTTRIRSLGGEQLVFSNSDLLSTRLRNFKRMQERRVLFQIGVLYQTTPEQLERIPGMIRGIVEAQDSTRFDRAHFSGFGPSSYDFEVVYWMLTPDYNRHMDTREQINLALVRAFEREQIEFAYPTQTLYLRRDQAPTDRAKPTRESGD